MPEAMAAAAISLKHYTAGGRVGGVVDVNDFGYLNYDFAGFSKF